MFALMNWKLTWILCVRSKLLKLEKEGGGEDEERRKKDEIEKKTMSRDKKIAILEKIA